MGRFIGFTYPLLRASFSLLRPSPILYHHHKPTNILYSTRALCMSEERFDLLNDDGTLSGVSKARSLVHRDGDLHRSTHIWIIAGNGSGNKRILLQKRAVGKDTYPGRWDVSAAGHICAGDTSLESAKRELEEELGISASTDIEKAFQVRACNIGSTEKHGAFIDNELQDVYVVKNGDTDIGTESMNLQEEEVERVEYWSWADFKKAQLDGDEQFVPRTKEYVQLLEKYLEEKWAAKKCD